MILVMWSGGLDSTGALFKLLTESKEPLHVHHIDIQNAEKRFIPEQYAVANISKIFKQGYFKIYFINQVFFTKWVGKNTELRKLLVEAF